MQLLKAKTGKIIHAQFQPLELSNAGQCACGKTRLLPVDETTAAEIVAKGGAYCPSALGHLEPEEATRDDTRLVSEPKTLGSLSPADIETINNRASDQLHTYRNIAGASAVKRVRGQHIHVKPRKAKRQRTRSIKRGAVWGQGHARISGQKMARASLYTHRCFQDVPGGLMLRQPLGGGDMVPARSRDRAALKAVTNA